MSYNPPTENKKSRTGLYLFLIAALLLVNGFVFYNSYKVKKENEVLKEQGMTLEEEKDRLETEYNETIAELEITQTDNENLTGELSTLQEEISLQKKEIGELLSKGKLNKNELSKARSMIAQFKNQAENYAAQIRQLEEANYKLSQEKQELEQTVVIKDAANEALEAQRQELEETAQSLSDEKQVLSEEKDVLVATVEKAKVLVADNIVGQGLKIKNNSDRKVTSVAKKVEELNVCFDLMPNKTLEGQDEVHIRVLNPEGVTLSLEKAGSGKFQLADTDKMLNYTMKKVVNNFTSKKTHCTTFAYDTEYAPGIYAVEVYHMGYKIGNNNFELKKGIL